MKKLLILLFLFPAFLSCENNEKTTSVIEVYEVTENCVYYVIRQSDGKIFEYVTEKEVNYYLQTGKFKYLPE